MADHEWLHHGVHTNQPPSSPEQQIVSRWWTDGHRAIAKRIKAPEVLKAVEWTTRVMAKWHTCWDQLLKLDGQLGTAVKGWHHLASVWKRGETLGWKTPGWKMSLYWCDHNSEKIETTIQLTHRYQKTMTRTTQKEILTMTTKAVRITTATTIMQTGAKRKE